jgi:hypothetical protein
MANGLRRISRIGQLTRGVEAQIAGHDDDADISHRSGSESLEEDGSAAWLHHPVEQNQARPGNSGRVE